MTAGIYKIIGPESKVYYGSSSDLNKRKYTHWRRLITNTHANWKIHKDLKHYGIDAFSFEVVETIPNWDKVEWNGKIRLINIEQIYLDLLWDSLDESEFYNIARDAKSPNRGRHFKHTQDTKNKLSMLAKGRVISEKQRQKLSEINKGKPSPNKGRTYSLNFTEEQLNQRALQKSGGKKYRIVSIERNIDEIIVNIRGFVKKYGLTPTGLYRAINRKQNKYNYFYIYYEVSS